MRSASLRSSPTSLRGRLAVLIALLATAFAGCGIEDYIHEAETEGIYVDVAQFRIAKGAAKGDPAAQIQKSGAREVSDGAIIFRSGNKLFIVDGTPPK